MIVLFTGVPGSGKTTKVVSDLAQIKDRPIFVMGIPDLKIPHQPVPPVSDWTRLEPTAEDAKVLRPVFNFPAHSIIVIDEAQNVYRPRASGSKVPDIVAAFETHRHTGVDFWLITQHPGLLDANIRKLVGKHLHVHVAPLGRKLLEWAQCRDPDSKTDRGDAVRIDYKPNPKVFGLFKSAEAHTKIKRRLSKSVVIMTAAAVMLVVLIGVAYTRISSKFDKPPTATAAAKGQGVTGTIQPGQQADKSQISQGSASVHPVESFTPVHPNYPESAPAYDAIRVVKSMPVVAGCVKTANWCRCYSQQGTKLEIQADRCGDIIANKVFDPYREPIQVARVETESKGVQRPTLPGVLEARP